MELKFYSIPKAYKKTDLKFWLIGFLRALVIATVGTIVCVILWASLNHFQI